MSFLKMRPEPESYNKLLHMETLVAETKIRDFILSLKENRSSATVSLYTAGLRKFFDINRVTLNWKWIRSFEGDKEKQAEDRPYSHSEIRMLVDRATLRNKAIILTMFSSGIRVGGLPHIRIKDLEPIDDYGIYRITVYPRSKKASYRALCTPEARKAIDSYLDWRRRFGEKIEPDSELPLFRHSFNVEGSAC
jgi:integrase